MRRLFVAAMLINVMLVASPEVVAHAVQAQAGWRAANAGELEAALPARARVEKERIETELRTASGIISSRGKVIAAVVLITAGYSADGKYSHYFLVQNPIVFGGVALPQGTYVLGWSRVESGLLVHVYDATTGVERGSATARSMGPGVRVEGFKIWPPGERSIVQIGRFELPYSLRESDGPESGNAGLPVSPR